MSTKFNHYQRLSSTRVISLLCLQLNFIIISTRTDKIWKLDDVSDNVLALSRFSDTENKRRRRKKKKKENKGKKKMENRREERKRMTSFGGRIERKIEWGEKQWGCRDGFSWQRFRLQGEDSVEDSRGATGAHSIWPGAVVTEISSACTADINWR